MRQRLSSRRLLFPGDFLPPRTAPPMKSTKQITSESVYDAWLASREMSGHKGAYLVPGATRPLTLANAKLALFVTQSCIFDFVSKRTVPVKYTPDKPEKIR